jgi:hypothetical protein
VSEAAVEVEIVLAVFEAQLVFDAKDDAATGEGERVRRGGGLRMCR